jgi:hypothetical protein
MGMHDLNQEARWQTTTRRNLRRDEFDSASCQSGSTFGSLSTDLGVNVVVLNAS